MNTAVNDTIDLITLTQIITNLVTVPADVTITRHIDEKGVLLSVMVNAKDMGIVIGRNGIMANSIKTIMRALGKAHDMIIRVEFLEPDGSNRRSVQGDQDALPDDLQEFAIT